MLLFSPSQAMLPTVVVLLFGVVTWTVPSALAQTELCRCTAKFEHFYDDRRRALREQQDRTLLFQTKAYDYSDYYIDDDGYYIVEGVRVLPDDDPACSGNTNRSFSSQLYAKIFGNGRNLGEEDEDELIADEEPHRALMGMMSSYGYSDDYYSYGKGKVSGWKHCLYCCVNA